MAFGSALIALTENETIELAIEMQALRIPRGSIEVEAVFEGVEGGVMALLCRMGLYSSDVFPTVNGMRSQQAIAID